MLKTGRYGNPTIAIPAILSVTGGGEAKKKKNGKKPKSITKKYANEMYNSETYVRTHE